MPTERRVGGHRVWVAGRGPSLVVVHGGPGFDHLYLTDALLPLSSRFRLVFYDQLRRAPPGGTFTPAALTERLTDIVAALASAAEGAFVLAHSWGGYLALACLARKHAPPVRGLVLVSTAPLTRSRFLEALERQAGAVSGARTMDEIFDRYLAPVNRGKIPPPPFHYFPRAHDRLMAALPDYDFTGACRFLPRRTHLVYGRSDPGFVAADTREIQSCAQVTTLSRAGHFAFIERPAAFQKLVIGTLL